jgi:hypothetical protein
MSKKTNNRETLYFQTAVLAEPSDHKSGRTCQNSYNFFLYKTRPHCVGLVIKVDLSSIGFGLKIVLLAEPIFWPGWQENWSLEYFSLQNQHTFSKNKFSRQILRFLTNF